MQQILVIFDPIVETCAQETFPLQLQSRTGGVQSSSSEWAAKQFNLISDSNVYVFFLFFLVFVLIVTAFCLLYLRVVVLSLVYC